MTNKPELPDDLEKTLATEQWWLFNNGQKVKFRPLVGVGQGTPGIDLNVLPLWPQYTGKGIKVGVIDDGVDGNHEDFAGNFNKDLSLSDDLGGPFPAKSGDNHGTSVAGIIAGRRNNLGTVGVAYDATIAGYKSNGPGRLPSLEAQTKFDVSNNSWGFNTFNFDNSQDIAAIKNAVTKGRGGLGTVFAWAGGNERENVNPNLPKEQQRGRNVNSGDYESSRYVIAVAAMTIRESLPLKAIQAHRFSSRPSAISLRPLALSIVVAMMATTQRKKTPKYSRVKNIYSIFQTPTTT